MKLPHIRIEYEEEESFAPGKVSLSLIIGFAVHWAWAYSVMFNGAHLMFPGSAWLQDALFLSSIAFLAVTLLCYGIFLKQFRTLFSTAARRSRNRLAASVMVFVGMLAAVLAGVMGAAQMALVICAGVLTGIGSAVLLMSFGVSFSVCDRPTVAVCIAAAVPLGAVMFEAVALLNSYVPPVGVIACLAFPFIECACLARCSHQLVDNLEFGAITTPVHTRPFALHVCLPCALFGFVMGIVSVRAIAVSFNENTVDVMNAMTLASLVCAFLLVGAMLTQRHSTNFTFRTLMPIAALFVACLGIAGVGTGAVAAFLLFGAYVVISVCVWTLCSSIAERFRISGFLSFGFGWGMLSAGMLVGAALCMTGAPLEGVASEPSGLIPVAFVVMMFGMSLLPTNAELRGALKRGTYCPAFTSASDYAVDELATIRAAINADDSVNVNVSEAAAPAGLADVAGIALQNAAGDVAAEVSAMHSVQAASPVPAAKAGTPAAQPAPAPAKAAPADQSGEEKERIYGLFKRKCAVLADRYMLSRKETEVLFLLAKGYKSAQIQEMLFISEGTANTHMRHIYRKLDVHSQVELMDMINAEFIPENEL